MSLTHAWPIYLGAAALALPVLIHYLTRPRPRRVPLSTLRFVQQVVAARRARHRLRDLLILAVRTLAIALLALALARPLIGDRALVDPAESGARSRVVLLDSSQSLAATDRGIQCFQRARTRAADYLAPAPGLRANLIDAGARPRGVFEGVSTNFAALREELARTQVRPERLNAQAALLLAGQMLSAAAPDAEAQLELVIVSDFQRTNWSAADFSVLPKQTRIELESVAPRATAENLAITRVGFQGRGAPGEELRLEVEVGNFSRSSRKVAVEVTAADAAYRLEGECPAGMRTTLTETVPARGLGWQGGEARLVDVDDALEADNRRPLVWEVRPPAQYLLVSAQPAAARGSSFYLERALAPLANRDDARTARVRRVETARLDDESALGAELAVLDHPGPLSAEKLQLLAGLLRRGRGVLYVAAEANDATNLKRLADLLGSNLQLPVEFVPLAPGQRRTNLHLTEFRKDAAPFRVFGDAVAGHVSNLRFSGGLGSRRLAGALDDDLVASYSDRSASLVITSSGAGTLAVWNADLGNSNLPASPAFVPLIGELVERLVDASRQETAVDSGETLAVYLPHEAGPPTGLTLRPPAGLESTAGDQTDELVAESLGTMWRAGAMGPPGVYRVERGENTVYALATQLPAEESELEQLDPAVLRQRLAGGRQVHYRSPQDEAGQRDDLWTWLALGAVAALLAEIGLLRAFRT